LSQPSSMPWWDALLQADADTSFHAAALMCDELQGGLGPDSRAWPAPLEDGSWGLTVRHDSSEMTGTFEGVRRWLAGHDPGGESEPGAC
jgi:hypothetical protein